MDRPVAYRIAALAATLAGCLGPAPEESAGTSVGERRAIDLPVVGLLEVSWVKPGWREEPGHGWCGATLIAPRVVLTAKTCITFVTRPGDARFSSELGTAVGVAFHSAGEAPAGLRPTHVGWAPADDLALIVLDHDLPVTEQQLRAVRTQPLDARPRAQGGDLGRPVVFVGYGTDVISPPGARHASTNWISSIGESTFELSAEGDHPCMWDYGDPVFSGAEIIGVVSYTFQAPEWDRRGYPVLCKPQTNTRVDRHLDVIQRALDDAATRSAASVPASAYTPEPATCPSAFDGVCDEGTLCEVGTDGDDCAGQV